MPHSIPGSEYEGALILFSAPMVRALLAGTKTQTRRVINPQPDSQPDMQCGWDPAIDPEREAKCAGSWLPLSDENNEALEALAVDGADGYGDRTHRLETR